MVRIASALSIVAVFSALVSGLPSRPRPRQDDSAVGIEVAVSAPNGIPITDSGELASQSSREAAQRTATAAQPVITNANYGAADGASSAEAGLSISATSPAALTTSTAAQHTQSSSVSHPTSSSLPSYGSGSSNWGNSEYEDCVQQCAAKYGSGAATYLPTATNTASYGTGATHTVIVAPTQGVLRFIPFAINATVGDTVKFMWGANNHTVTKSSALLPCNRSSDAVFASGVQNKDFVFTQVVNDTKPTYFFCGTPGHCQQGMYGIINPTTNFASPSSVGRSMQSIAANNSDVMAYSAYARSQTLGKPVASSWGSSIDLEALPDWARVSAAENVLYTRTFLAANPEVIKETGAIDLSSATSVPLSIPQDIPAVLASANTSTPAATTVAQPSATGSDNTAAESGVAAGLENGAMGSASPRLLVAAVAVFATFILL